MSKMTPDEMKRAIEKNRRTLLRLVSCWLIMAFFMRRARNTLPKRISNWVSTLIVKAEAATGYLIEASQMLGVAPMNNHCAFTSASKNHETGAVGDYANDCLTLDDIIHRLMAIKLALEALGKTRRSPMDTRYKDAI